MAKKNYHKNKKTGYRKTKSKYTKRRQLISIKYFLLMILIGFLGYGSFWGYESIRQLPCFDISKIHIEQNKLFNDTEICKLAGLSYQQNIFQVDTNKLKERIEKQPYIKNAVVYKQLPSTIHIDLQERVKFALVNAGALFIVDDEGVVLEKLNKRPWPNLPIISGVSSSELKIGYRSPSKALNEGINILKQLQKANLIKNVSEINVADIFNPMFYTLSEGVEIRLGDGQIKQKLVYMKSVWRQLNARIKEVESLDLRYQDMVVVRFKEFGNIV